MCARAPSHAVLIASIEGVPNRSVIKSSYRTPDTHTQTHKEWVSKVCFCMLQNRTHTHSFLVTLKQSAESETNLLNGALGLEEDASPKELSEDAAHRPDINGVGVVAAPHEDLWSSVVLCHYFLSHVPWLIGLLHSGQAKITDLEASHSEVNTLAVIHSLFFCNCSLSKKAVPLPSNLLSASPGGILRYSQDRRDILYSIISSPTSGRKTPNGRCPRGIHMSWLFLTQRSQGSTLISLCFVPNFLDWARSPYGESSIYHLHSSSPSFSHYSKLICRNVDLQVNCCLSNLIGPANEFRTLMWFPY